MSIDAKRLTAAAAFVALLILAVFWPAPVIDVNQLCCHAALPVDDLSFLGREAPSWDVVFWCIAGIFVIAILQSAESRDFGEAWRVARESRVVVPRGAIVLLVAGAALVAVTWRVADAPVTAWAERVQSDRVEDFIRIMNRLGGGMNPAMIVIFFLLAGVAYRHRRWIEYAVAMAIAGLLSGLVAQLVKFAFRRARPELWLGPFTHARPSATSFPSGHTVGAFALAGVIVFASRSLPFRVLAILIAIAIGLSRILALRHWTSDVLASALIGLAVAWAATRSVIGVTDPAAPRP
jgi:undecaprenyl-diphosphatase